MEPAAANPISDGAGQIPSPARLNSNEETQSSSKSHGQKRKWEDHKTFKQGSRRNKGKDMGRGEYLYVLSAGGFAGLAARPQEFRHNFNRQH
jgi:hypothetical protein